MFYKQKAPDGNQALTNITNKIITHTEREYNAKSRDYL